jgi:hypothetical protein
MSKFSDSSSRDELASSMCVVNVTKHSENGHLAGISRDIPLQASFSRMKIDVGIIGK